MDKPVDRRVIQVEKEIVQNCLAFYWRCRCCMKLGWSKRPVDKCEHYSDCKEFVYKKLKKHFKDVITLEKGL